MFLNELIRTVCGGDKPIRGAEVGVSKGETSRALLVAFPQLTLYMIDAWTTYPEGHRYRQSGDGHARLSQFQQDSHYDLAMRHTSFAKDRRIVLRMSSGSAAVRISEESLEFGFIDADHTYEGVKGDFWLYWYKVKYGGVICGHDIDHPRDKRGVWGVRKAVEEASARLGLPLKTRGDVWWILKERNGK